MRMREFEGQTGKNREEFSVEEEGGNQGHPSVLPDCCHLIVGGGARVGSVVQPLSRR